MPEAYPPPNLLMVFIGAPAVGAPVPEESNLPKICWNSRSRICSSNVLEFSSCNMGLLWGVGWAPPCRPRDWLKADPAAACAAALRSLPAWRFVSHALVPSVPIIVAKAANRGRAMVSILRGEDLIEHGHLLWGEIGHLQ